MPGGWSEPARSVNLRLGVNGCVTGDRQGDFYSNKRLTCDQCIALKAALEREGFVVSIGENKYNFYISVAW